MKIYTRTGDRGETSLASGGRVAKSHPRLEAYGTLDELNAWVGLVACNFPQEEEQHRLQRIQNRVFLISSYLAVDTKEIAGGLPEMINEDVADLESAIDKMQDELPPLTNFILPGGHQTVACCHLARTICRRAERTIIRLTETEEVPDLMITYINRLSDYFFVLARFASSKLGVEEIRWSPDFRNIER